jgi:hypothetical protein
MDVGLLLHAVSFGAFLLSGFLVLMALPAAGMSCW